ncbi:lipopolysaccharide biosynthesis protein [Halomicroarcula sp. GCM10025709]|uniref:lipopolysaccharide biosynthesis protein n=1 Tax=Haloarcula TaxID=2237 RepID=UPI0024C3880F|nr:lipopolysaccharide biosynthesis protein [Halomicroarcula sp. YJ-61-S]
MLEEIRYVTVAETVSRLSSFVVIPLLTRSLAPATFGTYKSIFLAVAVFLIVKGFVNGGPLLIKHVPEMDEEGRRTLIAGTTVLVAVAVTLGFSLLLGTAMTILFGRYFAGLEGFFLTNLPIIGAVFALVPAYNHGLKITRACDEFQLYSAGKLLREASFTLSIVVLVLTETITLGTALVAYFVTTAVAVVVLYWSLRRYVFVRPDFDVVFECLRHTSLPLAPNVVIKRATSQVPDAVVLAAFGPSVFAAWAVAFTFNSLFSLISKPLTQVLWPKISQRYAEDAPVGELLTQYYRVTSFIVVPAVVGATVLGPAIIREVFGPDYLYRSSVVAILVATFGLQVIDSLSSPIFVGSDQARYTTYVESGKAVIQLVFVLIGAFVFGSLAVIALGYLLRMVIGLCVSLWYQIRTTDLRRPNLTAAGLVLAANVVMGASVFSMGQYVTGPVSLFTAVGLGVLIYAGALYGSGALTEQDINLLRQFLRV